jgi:hypothetical protein
LEDGIEATTTMELERDNSASFGLFELDTDVSR